MAKQTITASLTDPAVSVDFEYDFGDTLADVVEKFGEPVVFAHVVRSFTIAAQGTARGMIKGGKDEGQIKAEMSKWKPGEPRVTKSPTEKIQTLVATLTPEQKEALMAELRGGGEPAAAKAGKKDKAA